MKGFGESEQDIVEKLSPREAIRESVRTRLRPIMMNSLTNFFGTLPLVLMPGAGSELYKGLGAVVLGGMLVATVFTLLVVPLVFSMTLDLKIWVYRRRGWPVPELNEGDRIETPAAPVPA
jgi:HAE1 family hydrophobic/amphiphilic exporter-1